MEEVRKILNSKKGSQGHFDLTKAANDEIGNLDKADGIDCPVCKNKGYILVDDDNEVTQSFIPCKCMTKRKVKRISEESGMGELLSYRVKNYRTDYDWQKNIRKKAIQYVTSKSDNWFCMLGQSGAGKTHICSAICNAFIDKFIEVRYIAWNTFTAEYKVCLSKGNANEYLSIYQNVEVLYIDDFFKGSTTEFDIKNIAFDLINYRYNKRLKTIISSELSFKDICAMDEAIAGRIKQMCGEYMTSIPRLKENNYRLNTKESKK
jgi:DNA replication protein DnaC